MAYSDYGAYVWCNGENITKKTCDLSNDYSGGHALLDFGDYTLEFYKTYEPTIKFKNTNKKSIVIKCFDIYNWVDKKRNLSVSGYHFDSLETINCFRIRHGEDYYLVICGSSVGNGFDKQRVSKYFLKNTYYQDGEYYFKTKCGAFPSTVVDYLIRKDDVAFERRLNWEYHIKPFLKNLLRFRFDMFYFKEIIDRCYNIHLLK